MIDSKLELNCPYQGTLSRQQELKVRNKYQWKTKKLMICDFHFWEKLRISDICIQSLQMFRHTSLTFLEGLAVIMISCPTCWKVQNSWEGDTPMNIVDIVPANAVYWLGQCLRLSILVKRHHHPGYSFKGKHVMGAGIKIQRLSPFLSWQNMPACRKTCWRRS